MAPVIIDFNIRCLFREKLERANDPNVEYVDMDDFRPGGKYAPSQSSQVAPVQTIEPLTPAEVVKASNVLAEIQVSYLYSIFFFGILFTHLSLK